ncbi:MAG: FAD-binding protein [Candidatus Aminicenantes bacterium]|nr:FAD-binding protein [Candidatus Aminicenantes bacterium]MDH5383844.1 FAD-binding protein [Candidatus Aminicenantes bacterium]MDH5743490.1 FAD-binding protein [Candidatus Aminicenantes bacterium]
MKRSTLEINGTTFPFYSLNTLIIGSGAAALNAAVSLHRYGQKDIAIATDLWGGGTSNNAGSDKQTYYKLSLAGDFPDSPLEMAQDLFKGGCMHGDVALCEALNSAQAFHNLVNLGVPFPHDRYGAYVGYKTDHDPRGRATSAGPLTSRLMFEALAKEIKDKEIEVYDRHEIIGLLTTEKDGEKHVIGAIAVDRNNLESENYGFVLFNAVNVVLATGGPAGIYKTSVYPKIQIGSHGLGFEIGAIGQNLTESQYGLASIKFRWNLSGTYQQVIPRYVSRDKESQDEQEFLNDYFPDMGKLATAIFLKGYQWPFDPRKVRNYGSSLIDILVYQETVLKGRRVFLDFTRNPSGGGILDDFSFDLLDKEAYEYLRKSGALFGTPIKRLMKMNQPAIDLYKDHGIDITKEYLEIAVCAQHNNGGMKGNIWWESNIKHLFPVGEVNGTHGVYRPGGSALNSGQVGSLRAALYISKRYDEKPPAEQVFLDLSGEQIKKRLSFARYIIDANSRGVHFLKSSKEEIQERMTSCGAHIRDPNKISEAIAEAWKLYDRMKNEMRIPAVTELPGAFKNLDLCLTQAMYLEAIGEYIDKGGQSRGSYLVLNPDGEKPCMELGEEWKFFLNKEDAFVSRKILEIFLDEKGNIQKQWVDIRSIPQEDNWFENVWNRYLNDETII